MGKIKQGILGGVSGTIGTVIGGFWNGVSYLRAKASNHKDAKSDLQISHRNRFKSAVGFARSIRLSIIRPIWNKKAVRMSGYNLFIKTNQQFFNEQGGIDNYELFKLAVGDLPLPANIEARNNTSGNGALIVSWSDNSGIDVAAPSDRIGVVAIVGTETTVLSGLTFTRSSQEARFQLPYISGTLVHLYIFFQNEVGSLYSESFYAPVLITSAPTP